MSEPTISCEQPPYFACHCGFVGRGTVCPYHHSHPDGRDCRSSHADDEYSKLRKHDHKRGV